LNSILTYSSKALMLDAIMNSREQSWYLVSLLGIWYVTI
jgi:hypothetical protein